MEGQVKVVKFGGSSLANAAQFRRVKEIVLSDESRRFVVPSAPGKRDDSDEKITDLLYRAHRAQDRDEPIDGIFEKIESRYTEIARELNLSVDIEARLKKVKRKILAGATADYAASRGEYLCGLLLADFLGYDFIDARDVICFDESGAFDPKRTEKVMERELAGKGNVVIPGFYGARPDGSIRTFSRGGSDISGSIVASAVQADVYENWTDVSGFLMADPRIVEGAKSIAYVTYKELRELSYMGATVLHEDAIFPVRQAGIPINVRNTNRPEDEGTMIVPSMPKGIKSGPITGIAGKKGFTVIAIEKDMMNSQRGFVRKFLSVVEKNGISFEHMPSGIDSISLVIKDSELEGRLDALLRDIQTQVDPDSIEINDNMAVIATVGRGMNRQIGVAAKLFTALSEARVNIRMIDQGSSEINIIVGVENDDLEEAVRAIYRAFVG